MTEPQTNLPLTTGGASTSPSPGAENSEKAPENTPIGKELPPQPSKAVQIFNWIKGSIAAQTYLPEDVAALVTLWVMSPVDKNRQRFGLG